MWSLYVLFSKPVATTTPPELEQIRRHIRVLSCSWTDGAGGGSPGFAWGMVVLSALLAAAPVAITFDLLPERVTLASTVLQGSGAGGLGAVLAVSTGLVARRGRVRAIERGNLIGGVVGGIFFFLGLLVQELF